MADVRLTINGQAVQAPSGSTVAAAVMNKGGSGFRQSVQGTPRGPLCGMGICFECRLTINGRTQQKSCQILCADGMVVETE
jgi:predicted molibdopterin-dependent oxidoreductase YjgC